MQNINSTTTVTLDNIISETYNDYTNNIDDDKDYAKSLVNVLKKYNYWPALQVKKFKGIKNQVLLHNTYIREDIDSFKELYELCRSIVLDFEAPDNNKKVVVSYSSSIPVRINIEDYQNTIDTNDKYYEAYDGTTSCPDINTSWYSHPTKTHGKMFDETLCEILSYEDENTVRNYFSEFLDKEQSYVFTLIHHENIHIINYKMILGDNYKKIIHINSKKLATCEDVNLDDMPLLKYNITYPKQFNNYEEAFNYMNIKENNSYGCIIKRISNEITNLAKISPHDVKYREDTDPCNPNPWYNILSTYMKNRVEYHINDYIRDYNPSIEKLYDTNGKEIDPTYLIHTSICTIKDVLFKLYSATTTYNTRKNLFKMNKEIDKDFAPLIRFHLAKLRRRQITVYIGNTVGSRDVYYYLCHCLRTNDLKQIIQLLTSTTGYEINERSLMCLVTLNNLLN
jgi:hypothetical protein